MSTPVSPPRTRIGNPEYAWDDDPATATSCVYGSGFCGGDFGFPSVGTISGHVALFLNATTGGFGAPRAEAYYSLNAGQDWTEFVYAPFQSGPRGFCSPQLVDVDSSTFLVQVRGDGEPGTASVHDISFFDSHLDCSDPIVVTNEGAQQIVSGTSSTAGGSVTVSVVLNIDKTPPSITPSVAPAPNAAGWNNTNAVVTFDCTDSLSGVATCNGPVTVTTEGQDQEVMAQATDLAGNLAESTALVSIDKTAPQLTLDQPPDGALIGGLVVPVAGSVADTNLAGVTCNSEAATVSGVAYSCSLAFADGSQPTITVQASDLADNVTTETADIVVDHVGVEILAPQANHLYGAGELENGAIEVSGTVDDPGATVTVNGQQATVTPDGGGGATFNVGAVTLKEGNNLLTATAIAPPIGTAASGAAGTASVQVTLDSDPPVLLVDCPPDGHITTQSEIVVAGMLNDIVVGTVNGGVDHTAVTVLNLDDPAAEPIPAVVKNRRFVSPPVSLLPDQGNRIQVTGTDAAGNQAEAVEITVANQAANGPTLEAVSSEHQSGPMGEELPEELRVAVRDAGNPIAGATVVFKVTQNNGSLRCLAQGTGGGLSECAMPGVSATGRSVAVSTDSSGEATAYWTLGTRSGAGNNIVAVSSPDAEGDVFFLGSSESAAPNRISIDTGNLQTGAPGEPLPRPFVAVVTDAGHNRLKDVPVTFTVTSGGGSITNASTDSDGRAVATLTLGPGEGLDNNVVEATFVKEDLSVSFPATFVASARVPMDPANTRVSGVVLDNTDTPLAGVTMSILGTGIETTTDDQGQFALFGVPVGNVILEADGTTVGDGQNWASLHFEMVTVAGRDNTLGMPVYLLPLDPNGDSNIHVSETEGGTITLPEVPGFALEIAPDSVTFPGGSKEGDVSVTVVHADKIPMTPTFGAQPRLAITIQPPGAKFDPPAKVTFPNTHGLAPGEVTELLSFDHDIGQFVSIGTGTVSNDGQVIVSDPGVGILESGWHGDCGCAGPTGEPEGLPLTCEQESADCEEHTTKDVVVIAWVDMSPYNLQVLAQQANDELFLALNFPPTCIGLLGLWSEGLRSSLHTEGDVNYANTFLIVHSKNDAPPPTIDPDSELNGRDYRLFSRLRARLTTVNGLTRPDFIQKTAEVGPTPDPCFGFSLGADEHPRYHGARGVRPSGTVYQITQGRLGSKGRQVDLTLNNCNENSVGYCTNIGNADQVTAWIWTVSKFSDDGIRLPLDHQIFPTYYVYENNQLVESYDGQLQPFVDLNADSQRQVLEIP